MADNRFDRILADMKELMLDESYKLTDEESTMLSSCYDGILLVYETSLDRFGEKKLGKVAYQALLEQHGIKPSLQEGVQLALGGRTPKEELPN